MPAAIRKRAALVLERLQGRSSTMRARAAERSSRPMATGGAAPPAFALFQDELIRLAYDYTAQRTSTAPPTRRTPSAWRSSPRRLRPRPAGAGLRHRSAVPAALQADRLGRERRRVHALSAVGSRLQGRPRDAHHRSMRCSLGAVRHHHPHRAARGAADPAATSSSSTSSSSASARRCVDGIARPFIDAKLAERDERQRAPATAATWSSPTSRTARAACATSTRCTGSPNISIATKADGRARRSRRVHRRRVSQLPALRGLPVDGALPPAFPDRPAPRSG